MLTVSKTRRHMLREHVHEAHERLDFLIGPLATAHDYERYLRGTAAFRLAAESAFENVAYPGWLRGWRPVRTGHALKKDLATLRLALPIVPVITPPSGDSALLGMLYTLEGSALGARIIARRAAAIGYTEAHGASHLAHQTAAPANWKVFLERLEDAPVFDLDEAGSAASMLFRHAYDAVTLVDRAEDVLHG